MAPLDVIWLVLVKTYPLPAIWWLHTLPSSRSTSGIAYASKQLSKIVGSSASYLLNIGE